MIIGNAQLHSYYVSQQEEILTEGALRFLEQLHKRFNQRRMKLLGERIKLQEKLNAGGTLCFLEDTVNIRKGTWTITPLPEDLMDRRVEITGPVDRKVVINALNSGANVFMADFEDATSPTWENIVSGQINIRDAIRNKIDFISENGKYYKLHEKTAVLVVRPRGWHLNEENITIDGEPMSASLVDFGLYFFHNAKRLMENGTGPYFYLPKLENHLEARLWNDVFIFSQQTLAIPLGTIKATVLIETICAAFEMEEILFELKEHSAGLNCGRWDYIFSYIKRFQKHPAIILPDRSTVTMETPFMRAYSLLAIKTCHKRNAPAIGGMAAQIPVKGDENKNRIAYEKVRADKEREVRDGHDGTWVAHPGMVQLVKDVFDKEMPSSNQINRKLEHIEITSMDLLENPTGIITLDGVRTNISVGIEYIAAWLQGRGAVPINHLMEDAATAEISRAQIWQWIRHPQGKLEDGSDINLPFVKRIIGEEMERLHENTEIDINLYENYQKSADIFLRLVTSDEFIEFLTIPAYQELIKDGRG
ncbi:malate synthase A [Ornithinibacillus xuwenensis]|uniref:Malate synthase n=1 Tax=Ornithinibacillus xuwenensis TaxID=3144668 RepID=A0ABU9XJD5_9BACI